jgi:hypothetical protein
MAVHDATAAIEIVAFLARFHSVEVAVDFARKVERRQLDLSPTRKGAADA